MYGFSLESITEVTGSIHVKSEISFNSHDFLGYYSLLSIEEKSSVYIKILLPAG